MASPARILRQQRANAPSRARVDKADGRFILQDKRLTMASAKALTTKAINRGDLTSVMGKGGQDLKFSIEKMGERLGLDSERMEKIRNMDADALQALYDSNDLVFDVFFSYEGVDDHGDYKTVTDDKKSDADFFINQYERAFGKL